MKYKQQPTNGVWRGHRPHTGRPYAAASSELRNDSEHGCMAAMTYHDADWLTV